mmetsp:Transcript_53020/g.148809  ORF Transcript_53020/g.148809 Transcript_53020/m.148809 type:complete len:565 (+) Transcript_53020:627-2321(+)
MDDDVLVLQEGREHADGVRASADAGDDMCGQAAGAVCVGGVLVGLVQHLRPRLIADHGLQLAHNVREGVRADGRADDVVGGADVRHPVAHRLVDRVLQGLRAALRRHHLGTEHLHPEDVQRLALHVNRAHVDDALQAHQRAGRRSGDAVLPGTGLSDDATLPKLLREQRLAQGVVDLVSARVRQLLALEPQLGAAKLLRQILREVQRGGAANELSAQAVDLLDEGRVLLDGIPSHAELLVGLHQRLWDVPATELAAEVPRALALGRRVHTRLLGRRRTTRGLGGGQGAARELRDKLLHGLHAPLRAQGRHDLRPDDDAIRILADLGHLLPLGDSEADDHVHTRCADGCAHARNHLSDLCVHTGASAGDAQHANDIDEGVGELRRNLHALIRACRRDDRHEAQAVLDTLRVEVTRLLCWEVDDDEAIDALRGGLLAGAVKAVLQEVVVVAHHHQGDDQTLLPGLLHEAEAVLQRSVLQERQARRLLDGRAVGQGIGEGNAQLDDVRAALLQREERLDRVRLLRVPRGDEGHEGRPLRRLALLEALADPGGWHLDNAASRSVDLRL